MPKAETMDLLKLRRLDRWLAAVAIETDGEPQPFAAVADDWQRADVAGVAPMFERLVREDAPEPQQRRAMWVRPRGHSKTADAALLVCYVLAMSRRRRRAVWCAADKDQGCEGLDSIATLCRHNPWLENLLTIRADRVENPHTGSVCHFTTSDVSSAFGWKDCDVFILDEVSHWRANGEELWTAMYSAAAKRRNAVVLVLMNAGFDNWVRKLRDSAAADPNWIFSELPDCVASWIDPAALADQQKYLPPQALARLWRNRWVEGQEGDAIDAEQLRVAFDPTARPHDRALPGISYVAGLDLGIVRHASCVCVLGCRRDWQAHGSMELAALRIWRPAPGRRVDLAEVERELWALHQRFDLKRLLYDPWEARGLAAKLQAGQFGKLTSPADRKAGLPMVECPPSAANLQKLANALIQAFADCKLRLFGDPALRRDLELLRVEERQFGIRLVSPEVRKGQGTPHGDAAAAFAMSVLAASDLAAQRRIVAGVGSVAKPGQSPLDKHLAQLAAQQTALERHEARIRAMPSDGFVQAFREKFGRVACRRRLGR